jgi:hypothetical protein
LPHQGRLEIAGMFGAVKVLERLGGNDYRDPGWLNSRIGVSASADKFPIQTTASCRPPGAWQQ